jgi:protocatechuate 3,4-dioxygenase beta subunit
MLTPTAQQVELDDHHHQTVYSSVLWSRRSLIGGSLALAGAAMVGATPTWAADPLLRPTDTDDIGPFYPQSLTASEDFDLTRMKGRKRSATGELLYVSGRVLNIKGEPVSNAVLEVWQANAAGRYAHPGDDSKSPLDPNFQGFARIRSGKDGGFRLKTIYPGSYGDRTRHIHFDVRGQRSRLITQMYFEGEPRNDSDALLKAHSDEDRKTLIARRGSPTGNQESNAVVAEWNVVLAFG